MTPDEHRWRAEPPGTPAVPPPALGFTVHGRPAPQGSQRATIHRTTGRVVTFDSSARVKPWRQDVLEAATAAFARPCGCDDCDSATPHPGRFEGPLTVRVLFTFDRPRSAPKRRRAWPITRASGDVDKLVRAVLDALVSAGCVRDDSQVVNLHARKLYVGDRGALPSPGAHISVWTLV